MIDGAGHAHRFNAYILNNNVLHGVQLGKYMKGFGCMTELSSQQKRLSSFIVLRRISTDFFGTFPYNAALAPIKMLCHYHKINKYVGPYCRDEMYAGRVACFPWWVTVSMPTGRRDRGTDRRTPDRYVMLSARHGQLRGKMGLNSPLCYC